MAKLGESIDKPYLTEELLMMTFLASGETGPEAWKRWSYERLRSSSLHHRAPIFASDAEARALAFSLKRISEVMAHVYQKDPQPFAVDVEWNIFGAQRTLSINQVRPFKASVKP